MNSPERVMAAIEAYVRPLIELGRDGGLVIGDGGFHFTGMELSVAVQEQILVTVILCNNQAFGAIRSGQDRNFGSRRFGSNLWNPDYGMLAAAFGIPCARVTDAAAFQPALTDAISSGELRIIELAMEMQDP